MLLCKVEKKLLIAKERTSYIAIQFQTLHIKVQPPSGQLRLLKSIKEMDREQSINIQLWGTFVDYPLCVVIDVFVSFFD